MEGDQPVGERPRGDGSRRHLLLALLAAVLTIGCDRVTKDLATAHLRGAGQHSYLGDTVRLEYVENRGAFLGLGRDLSARARFWALTVGTGVLLLVLTASILLARGESVRHLLAWALVCGGGLSNLVDRVARDGLVVDFLNLGIGPLRTGVFNVADVAITTGVSLLLLGHARKGR